MLGLGGWFLLLLPPPECLCPLVGAWRSHHLPFFLLVWDILIVPSFIFYGDGGRRVPCQDVAVEGNYMAVERGPVCIGEGEFFNSPEDSYVARWPLNNDDKDRPLLLRQGNKDVRPLGRCFDPMGIQLRSLSSALLCIPPRTLKLATAGRYCLADWPLLKFAR